MNIFLQCLTTLTGFTSSIPMRGLVLELIHLRPEDTFILFFNENDRYIPYMKEFFENLKRYKNIQLVYAKYSRKLSNFKALLGISNYLNIKHKADVYISPGTVDFFGKQHLPLINMLGDLSAIRKPEYSSMPWHGKYILKNILKYSIKYASKIICISNFTREDLIQLYPQAIEKTCVIYDGIEKGWFDGFYEPIQVDGFTNYEYGYWIWYGYISKRKNILNLLKAYKLLRAEYYNIPVPKILLIGKLAPNQYFLNDFICKHFNHFVKIIPHQDFYRLKYLVKKSRGLLFPSIYEGFGLPVIESYSQGIPVLHSNVTSLPEIAGGLGIPCNPYDIKSIMTGMVNLLNNADTEEIIEKRKKWAANFTYEKAARQFSKIIDEIMAG